MHFYIIISSLLLIVFHSHISSIEAAKTSKDDRKKKHKTKDPKNLSNICGTEYPLSPQALKFAEKVYDMSGSGALRRSSSAQHQALCWMVLSDGLQLNSSDKLLLERYALVTLYAASNGSTGDSWIVKENWLSKTSHCKWYGVKCYSNGRTKSLNLNFNGLSGVCPKEIGLALGELKSLYLHSNELQGKIPNSIFSLKKLKYLQLHANNFEGTLPDLSNVTNLRELYVYGNNLSGSIPKSISKLRNLEVLDLFSNNFSGFVNDKTFDGLSKLKEVYLDDTNFTGKISKKSAICKNNLDYFTSDCRGGMNAEVSCACCTKCCHDKADPKCIEMKGQ
mmetsp:Transcript_7994/g.10214  ORF Transcript_7994/g.10214 Transcript_7994/m.10214 type:complete len:335 (+) Transcript_7994:39-1043(+)